MIQRQQYMSGEYSHREYHAQFVTQFIKSSVKRHFGERLIKSTDEHFNDIPLSEWDWLAGASGNRGSGGLSRFAFDTAISLKSVGDYMTLGAAICILKEAGRQVVEEWR